MKNWILLLCAVLPAMYVQAEDKRALALQLMEVTDAKKNHEHMVQTYMNSFKSKPELYNDTFLKIFTEAMAWEALVEPMISITVNNYTEHELRELLKFMSSDVGKSFTKKAPIVTQQTVQLMTGIMMKSIAEHNKQQKNQQQDQQQ